MQRAARLHANGAASSANFGPRESCFILRNVPEGGHVYKEENTKHDRCVINDLFTTCGLTLNLGDIVSFRRFGTYKMDKRRVLCVTVKDDGIKRALFTNSKRLRDANGYLEKVHVRDYVHVPE